MFLYVRISWYGAFLPFNNTGPKGANTRMPEPTARSAALAANASSSPSEDLLQKTSAAGLFSIINEKPLHSALKKWYAQPGDAFEVAVDGFVADILRGDLLIEIQTRSFSSLKTKLNRLLPLHPVRLVYPVAQEKWITRVAEDGCLRLGRRRSPRHGGVEDLFNELVSFPNLLRDPHFSIEVVLIEEEEIRRHDDLKGWRRKGWLTCERQLLQVFESRLFTCPADLAQLIPPALAEPFTTLDLALALHQPRRLAQRMVYCLRLLDCLRISGKKGRAIQYCRVTPPSPL
jgi:hypothetical protein